MPARNSIKHYVPGGLYHIYNRGVNKAEIFHVPEDYAYFISSFKEYLTPKAKLIDDSRYKFRSVNDFIKYVNILNNLKNYSRQINLIAYCLMPNHFHLLLKQKYAKSIVKFMRSLETRYALFCNKKYNRVGTLFQGRYRAINITSLNYFLTVSRYIHRNPMAILPDKKFEDYPWSSCKFYISPQKVTWLKKEILLKEFQGSSFSKVFKDYNDFLGVRP